MASKFAVVWLVIALNLKLSSVHSQTCTSHPVGPDVRTSRSISTTNSLDVHFLMSNGHPIDCYGIVQFWLFRSAPYLENYCYTTTVQIWRPTPSSPTGYTLVGENTLFDLQFCQGYLWNNTVHVNRINTVSVPTNLQIPVEPGDVIAWRDNVPAGVSYRKIGYDSGLPGSSYMATVRILQNACPSSVGASCDWPTQNIFGRNYGLQANVVASTTTPIIINLPKTITTSELQPIGTFIYQVVANNSFTANPTIPPKMTYAISGTSPTTCLSNWFAIDSDLGNISTASVFSIHPTATANPYSCMLSISVTQISNGAVVSGNLTINVSNVNQPPTITNLPATVYFNVMQVTPATLHTVNVTDPDYPTFSSTRNFSIVSVEPFAQVFQIDQSGVVSVSKSLSGWTGPDTFKINITVTDGALSDGPETLTVVLYNLIQPPVIKNLNATISLPENPPAGIIFTVICNADPLRNSITVTYTILSQVPYTGVGSPPFSITSSSNQGIVMQDIAFDYLIAKKYDIEIQATQNYNYSSSILLSEPRTLTVEVTWVNKPPTISISPTITQLPENTPIAYLVPLTIVARDRDADNNLGDYLTFFVSDSHFVIDNVTKTMRTAESLFITSGNCIEVYLLDIFVRDSYGEVATTSVVINVTRINRQSPKFSQTQYSGSVSESGVGGNQTGVRLNASDPDCDNNGIVTYSILDEIANMYFQVDPSTGVITQKQPISQPTYPNMTFTVVAADGGQPSLNSTATVFITVIAGNMHAPWFTSYYMETEERSDSPVGSTIYTLNVTDPDSGDVNNISYQIVVLQDDFEVKSSGVIVPKRGLSSYQRYTLYVMATDTGQGMNYFTDPATVVIDTYDAKNQLIDIRMLRPLSETDPKVEEFMVKINDFLKPWLVKMEDLKYDGDDTIITIYAYKGSAKLSVTSTPKEFIDRDEMLGKLRTNIEGTPVDGLRGPEFEDYEIVSVHPTYPVWVVDTPEGIATLTIVCCVALAIIILITVLLLRHFKLLCFKNNKVGPLPEKVEPISKPSGEEFQLSYANTEPYNSKSAEAKLSDMEPFEDPPTYRTTSPPLRPDADLQL